MGVHKKGYGICIYRVCDPKSVINGNFSTFPSARNFWSASYRWNILRSFMLLEINVKIPQSCCRTAQSLKKVSKITFRTHNILCFFHKFYIRISVERLFANDSARHSAKREVDKYFSSDPLYTLALTQPRFTLGECQADEIRASERPTCQTHSRTIMISLYLPRLLSLSP